MTKDDKKGMKKVYEAPTFQEQHLLNLAKEAIQLGVAEVSLYLHEPSHKRMVKAMEDYKVKDKLFPDSIRFLGILWHFTKFTGRDHNCEDINCTIGNTTTLADLHTSTAELHQSQYYSARILPQGWQCPGCDKVYAPHISECDCQTLKATTITTTPWDTGTYITDPNTHFTTTDDTIGMQKPFSGIPSVPYTHPHTSYTKLHG